MNELKSLRLKLAIAKEGLEKIANMKPMTEFKTDCGEHNCACESHQERKVTCGHCLFAKSDAQEALSRINGEEK